MTELQPFRGDWLDNIPRNWSQKKIKHLFTIKKDISGELGHDVISITQRGAKIKDVDSGQGQVSMDYSKYQLVKTGNFLMNHMDLLTGYVDISQFDGVTSPDYRVFELKDQSSFPRYHLYLFQHCYKSKIFYGYGRGSSHLGRWRFPTVEFEDFYLPVPPYKTQELIVRYLDKKTEQIDSLIDKIQKKIELLKEQRTSLINQCVTKGLNPNVEMKDSGVEWIGEIPSHWGVSRIKYLHLQNHDSFIDGDWIESQYITDQGIRYITTGNIGEGVFKYQGNSFISKDTFLELKCTEVFPGDLVISRLSPPVGRSCIIPDLGNRIVTSVDNVIIRLKESLSINYYNYLFNSQRSYENSSTLSRGTTLTRISRTMLGNIETVVPPTHEQHEIVRYLDERLKPIDQIIQSEKSRKRLLDEYRQSLISSVVTGKVRVTEDMV